MNVFYLAVLLFLSKRILATYRQADQRIRGSASFIASTHRPLIPATSYGKQVVTLGPASSNFDTIKKLIESGTNVFRLNFSHGQRLSKLKIFETIKIAEKETNAIVSVMADIQGPKIRIGRFVPNVTEPLSPHSKFSEYVFLTKGQVFTFDNYQVRGDGTRVQLPYPEILKLLRPGHHITLDDGNIKMVVTEVNEVNGEYSAKAEVQNSGKLSSNKGFSCPDIVIPIEVFSEKDVKDMAMCLALNVDLLALSFIQSHKDIRYAKGIISHFNKFENRNDLSNRLNELRRKLLYLDDSKLVDYVDEEVELLLDQFYKSLSSMDLNNLSYSNEVGLIPKIEKKSALDDIHNILLESDGIMVARGDLGIETELTNLPSVQKRLAFVSRIVHKKPCIVATQMLESMVSNPRPTRAEVSDVSNAMYDGADAVMLSAESAVGKYPVEAVSTQRKVMENTLSDINFYSIINQRNISIHELALLAKPTLSPRHQKGIDDQLSVDIPFFESIHSSNKNLFELTKKIASLASSHNIDAIGLFADSVVPINWISSNRLDIPIFAFIPPKISRLVQLTWGVTPVIFDENKFNRAKETSTLYNAVLQEPESFANTQEELNMRAMDYLTVQEASQLNPEHILVIATPNFMTNQTQNTYLKLTKLN